HRGGGAQGRRSHRAGQEPRDHHGGRAGSHGAGHQVPAGAPVRGGSQAAPHHAGGAVAAVVGPARGGRRGGREHRGGPGRGTVYVRGRPAPPGAAEPQRRGHPPAARLPGRPTGNRPAYPFLTALREHLLRRFQSGGILSPDVDTCLWERVGNPPTLSFMLGGVAVARDVVAQVTPVAEELAAELGLEVVDVEYRREGGGWVLRVFIDKPGGVTL